MASRQSHLSSLSETEIHAPAPGVSDEFDTKFQLRLKNFGITIPNDHVGLPRKDAEFDKAVEAELIRLKKDLNIDEQYAQNISAIPMHQVESHQDVATLDPKRDFDPVQVQSSTYQAENNPKAASKIHNEYKANAESSKISSIFGSNLSPSPNKQISKKEIYAQQLREQIEENSRRKDTKYSEKITHDSTILKQNKIESESIKNNDTNRSSSLDLAHTINDVQLSDSISYNIISGKRNQKNVMRKKCAPENIDLKGIAQAEKKRKQKLYAKQLAEQIEEQKKGFKFG